MLTIIITCGLNHTMMAAMKANSNDKNAELTALRLEEFTALDGLCSRVPTPPEKHGVSPLDDNWENFPPPVQHAPSQADATNETASSIDFDEKIPTFIEDLCRYFNKCEVQNVVVTATKLNALLSQFDSAGPHPSIALLHTCINLVTLIEKDETDDKKCAKLFTEYQDAMKQALTLLQPLYAQRIKK